jgi:predicted aspartyl protease
MIHGVVNFRYELTLSLVVGNSNGKREFVNTVIDTGFDGFLSLPSEIIVRLGLPWRTSNVATLGDGSKTLFDFYTGTVIWDGQYRTITSGRLRQRYCRVGNGTSDRIGNTARISFAGR